MSYITGVGLTAYGRHEGSSTLDLMGKAAALAIADAGLKRSEIDGILCGYSTVSPHIMLATLFAEHFGMTQEDLAEFAVLMRVPTPRCIPARNSVIRSRWRM